ncbi:SDR family oxidoreductase [Cohnella thailandensis]|uniref:SDR family oxidoreductase n=1 Tax=Cohnella thailandensis TaxID=557557 RepID=A0A841T6B1_9BACL|nr:SDR family oxidoreductase [Cohnella thailandensis]MBB6637407.1 SDR family oxidoreductase [Cohnella thailandensis]MBP1976736.1 NAD(P)-dependent dehydrogenase (short-subunit alcohol dehydrogenase family) [Cohnella thailandensis]
MRLLITGAGRGLGYELTEAAVREGHSAIACVRDAAHPGPQLAGLAEKYPERVRVKGLDITDEADAIRLAGQLWEERLCLDAIVNNAGVLKGREDGIETLSLSDVRETLEVNLTGPMSVAKHMIPLMRDSEAGMVVNVSSEAGSFSGAYGGDYPYAISKLALNMFTKQLNEEMKPRGIRALAVHPGWIRTDMGGPSAPLSAGDSARGILDILTGRTKIPEEFIFVDYLGRQMPL